MRGRAPSASLDSIELRVDLVRSFPLARVLPFRSRERLEVRVFAAERPTPVAADATAWLTRASTLKIGAATAAVVRAIPEALLLIALAAVKASLSVSDTAPFIVDAARFGIDHARTA